MALRAIKTGFSRLNGLQSMSLSLPEAHLGANPQEPSQPSNGSILLVLRSIDTVSVLLFCLTRGSDHVWR